LNPILMKLFSQKRLFQINKKS